MFLAIAWIVAAYASLGLVWAPFFWCCCSPPTCTGMTWPSTATLHTELGDVTLTWNGTAMVGTLSGALTGFREYQATAESDVVCQECSPDIGFSLRCVSGNFVLRYTVTVGICIEAYADPDPSYCDFACAPSTFIDTFWQFHSSSAYVEVTISTYTISPIAFSGTWGSSWTQSPPGATECTGFAVPMSGSFSI